MSVTQTAQTPLSQTYSTHEAALLAGISYRMLDYWLRTGTVQPEMDIRPGSGRQRRWTSHDVDTLCEVVAHWRNAQAVVDDFRQGELWVQISRKEQE